MEIFKNFDREKWLYNGLIITFILLYAATAFVSFYHAITFFNIANAIWLSVLLSFVAEIGQASVLFSILLTKHGSKFLPWVIMFILTSLQIIGNVDSSFNWIVSHNDAGLNNFKRSILFFVQTENDEMFRVIVAWISGALLPVIALSMTALVAQNINIRKEKAEEDEKKKIQETSGSTISQEIVVNASDIMSEVSKIRPTKEDLDQLDVILKNKIPINEIPKEDEADESQTKIVKPKNESFIPKKNPDQLFSFGKNNEIENVDEPDVSNNEFDSFDLTTEISDKISQKNVESTQESTSNIENENKERDFLDEEVEQLIPEKTEITLTPEEKIIEEFPKVKENPPIEPNSHIETLTAEQLERIRQIARDNLKKK